MDRKRLGETGLTVSALGLGLAALGRPGYVNLGHGTDLADPSPSGLAAHTWRVLDAAVAAEITYLDAARSYGRAEQFLGSWLRERGTEAGDLVIGSKWGYTYTANWQIHADVHEIKNHSLDTFERQIDQSRQLLGDQLAMYQVHSATPESGILDDGPTHEALVAAKKTGLIIGLTTSGAAQSEVIRRAIELQVGGERVFDTVQTTWNLLEPSAGAALAEASDAGLGVVVKEAVANGRLTGRNESGDIAALRSVAVRHGVQPDAVALAAALAQPWADVVLSGAATIGQLDSNVQATRIDADSLDPEALAALAEAPERYWQTRRLLSWN